MVANGKQIFSSHSQLLNLCQEWHKWTSLTSVSVTFLEIKLGYYVYILYVSISQACFIFFPDKEECKKTIQWLCDYVQYQAKQPAPFHSRDLHSMMVAAFTCLLTWITSHSWLLDDQVPHWFSNKLEVLLIHLEQQIKNWFILYLVPYFQKSLQAVLEVVELGISGSKSKVCFKDKTVPY